MEERLPVRKNLRLRQYDYRQPGYYFVTICTKIRCENILCRIEAPVGGGLCAAPLLRNPDIILTNIGQIVAESIEKIPNINPNTAVDIYVIMPDHVHMVLQLTEDGTGRRRGRPLQDIIGRFKSYTDHYYRTHESLCLPYLWQEGYYDHIIRNTRELNQIRQYITNNPAKWQEERGGCL